MPADVDLEPSLARLQLRLGGRRRRVRAGAQGLWAFPERCSLSCRALWHAHVTAYGGRLVSAAGGLVFLQDESVVKVFRSSCRSDGGPVIRSGKWPIRPSGHARSTPTVACTSRVASTRWRPTGPGATEQAMPPGDRLAGPMRSPSRCRVGACTSRRRIRPRVRYGLSDGTGCPALWRTRPTPERPVRPHGGPGTRLLHRGRSRSTRCRRTAGRGSDLRSGVEPRVRVERGLAFSPPTVTDRAVFVVSADGALYSFEVPAG